MQVQDQIGEDFKDKTAWAKRCIVNVASGGFFSSDRTISQYTRDIWRAYPVPIEATAASGSGDVDGADNGDGDDEGPMPDAL